MYLTSTASSGCPAPPIGSITTRLTESTNCSPSFSPPRCQPRHRRVAIRDMKPTIVLVHGAFADASSWNGVIERLQQQEGYTVIAPPNPLRGVGADSAYLASPLNQIDRPVLLTGQSYGGAMAATQRPVTAAAFSDASGPPAWRNLPSWAVVATGDK